MNAMYNQLRHILSAVFLLHNVLYIDAANTTVTCKTEACSGQVVDMTCQIVGGIQSGISWTKPGGLEIITCNQNLSKCLNYLKESKSGYKLMKNSITDQTLRIKSFNETDIGKWICRDGINAVTENCNIVQYKTAPKWDNTTSCSLNEDKSKIKITCGKLSDPGDPPVKVMIEGLNNETLASGVVLASEVVSIEVPLDAAGQNVKCVLDGPAAKCVPEANAAKCPTFDLGDNCAQTVNCKDPEAVCMTTCQLCKGIQIKVDGSCQNDGRIIVAIVIPILLVLALIIVIVYLYMRKKKQTASEKLSSTNTSEGGAMIYKPANKEKVKTKNPEEHELKPEEKKIIT